MDKMSLSTCYLHFKKSMDSLQKTMNWTDADEIAYCEAAAETDWDFKDIQFLKSPTTSKSPQPPKKSSDSKNDVKEKSTVN